MSISSFIPGGDAFVEMAQKGIAKANEETTKLTAGLEKTKDVIAQVSHGFQVAAVPAAALTAVLVGMAMAGFQGTVELQQLHLNFQLFTREIASVSIPVIEAVTAVFSRLWRVMSGLGANGQKILLMVGIGIAAISIGLGVIVTLLGLAAAGVGVLIMAVAVLTAIIYALDVAVTIASGGLNELLAVAITAGVGILAIFAGIGAINGVVQFAAISAAIGGIIAYSEPLRNSLWGIVVALGRCAEAAWPLVKALLVIGGVVLERAIVQPLITFCFYLEAALNLLEKMINRLIASYPIIARIGAALNLGGGRRDVALNQTGEESAQGTFSRIQQAALQVNADRTPVENNTTALETLTIQIQSLIDRLPNVGGIPDTPSAASIAGGYSSGGFAGAANAATGGLLGRAGRAIFGGGG